jgi:hypothetical protein
MFRTQTFRHWTQFIGHIEQILLQWTAARFINSDLRTIDHTHMFDRQVSNMNIVYFRFACVFRTNDFQSFTVEIVRSIVRITEKSVNIRFDARTVRDLTFELDTCAIDMHRMYRTKNKQENERSIERLTRMKHLSICRSYDFWLTSWLHRIQKHIQSGSSLFASSF